MAFNITIEKQAQLELRIQQLGIQAHDLKEKFTRGSGHGGQKVNKTSNCVWLTHIPSNISIKCHQDRSREMNRFFARRALCDALEQIQSGKCSVQQQALLKLKKQKKRRKRRSQQNATVKSTPQASSLQNLSATSQKTPL